MKLSTSFALSAVMLAAFVSRVHTQECYDEYKIYDIVQNHGGTLNIDDGWGKRTIQVDIIEVHACARWPVDDTGTETGGPGASGLTTISLTGEASHGQDDPSNGDCRINNSTKGGATSHWWPIQGLRISSTGWRFEPKDLIISDVDMEGSSDPANALRKAALVFGYKNNVHVNASYEYPGGSKLFTHAMKVEDHTLNAMGHLTTPRADDHFLWVDGTMTNWGNETVPLLRCNTGAQDPACATHVSFEEPIDGFFILHALEWKSLNQEHSLISVGNLKIPCGCRCERVTETRKVTLPASTAGECTQKVTSDTHAVCKEEGAAWCTRKTFDRYTVSGPILPNGNYPCDKSSGTSAAYERVFAA